jgi:hypothetical protein
VVEHLPAVAVTEAYASLPRHLADAVALELGRRHARCMALLQGMATRERSVGV